MMDFWPKDNSTLLEAIQRASVDLGVFSTAWNLFKLLEIADKDIYPSLAYSKFGSRVELFPEILSLQSENPNYLDQRLKSIRSGLLKLSIDCNSIISTCYESEIWDGIFDELPQRHFYVVRSGSHGESSRLKYFANVTSISLEFVRELAGVESSLVFTGYGFVRGTNKKVYSTMETLMSYINPGPFNTNMALVNILGCPVQSLINGVFGLELTKQDIISIPASGEE